MDKFDQAIIQALRQNARQSVSHIAEQVNLSRSSVSERIKKLEQKNIIRGYQVLLNEPKSAAISAYFEVKHTASTCLQVQEIFYRIPEVVTCHGISGEMDIMVFVEAESMQRLREIREFVDEHRDIVAMKTHVVMSEWVNNRHKNSDNE